MTVAQRNVRRLHAYGHGRIGALQEHLLTQADVDRMISAASSIDLARIITELKLSSNVEYTSNPHRFINHLEKWLQRELWSMVDEDEREVFNILWLKDDAALMSYLLKENAGFTSSISAEPHVGATAFNPEDLRLLVRGQEVIGAPPSLRRFVQGVRGAKDLSPQGIDTKVAQFVADMKVSIASNASENIRLFVAHHIDLQNVRTARRLRKDEKPEHHLLKGGDIDISRFSLDRVRLASLVRASHLGASLAESIQTSEESSIVLERGLAKAIAVDLARMRSNALTIDPLFAFGAVTQSQLRLLRTILIGKSAHLSATELKKLLPPFLSASPYAS